MAAAVAAVPAGAAPAAAQVQGPCQAWFNGVEADRIDSLSSPLLLGDDDALVFSGIDSLSTQNAELAVLLGPASLGRVATPAGAAAGDFTVSLALAEVAPYGVGLLRVRGTTDNCTAEVWLRLGGRIPFTTLVGLTGTGLAVAGLTGQISAVVARRRWSIPVAAAAGVATGAGGALLGQEFGRLQLSYLSLGVCIALAAAVGVGLVVLLRRRPGREETTPTPAEGSAAGPPPQRPSAAPRPEPSRHAPAVTPGAPPEPAAALPSPQEPAAARAPAPRPAAGGPFWCYVMTDVEVLHLDDYSRVVATLRPGTWYLAKRDVSGWTQVVAPEGVEGWVPRQSLHREG